MAEVKNAQNAAPAKVDNTTGADIVPTDANRVGAKGVKTTKMDLDHDFNINGQDYKAGKGVEINKDHVQAVKDMTDSHGEYLDWASTHHGAVPAPNDPQEATAQTPTRPLGGEHVQQPTQVKPVVNSGDAVRVADPNEGNEAATEVAKGADVVDAGEGQVK
jgi:hypothetical protein